MKRGLRATALCAATLFFLYSDIPCRAFDISTSAESAILMDADSGRVLYQRNADAKMGIASTTKILTALVAIEDGSLQRQVKVSREAACTEGSSMYLQPGEELTLEELLYGLLLCSGNDAASAIAEAVGGNQAEFARRMNQKAEEIGMHSSSFANASGLDQEDHYSTARDMARLACAALENETLMRMASTRKVTIGSRTMSNHNRLLREVRGCIGLKTGYTRAAGRTLVTCAERNGQRLVAVTLRDGDDWADHARLYEYGFETYPSVCGAAVGELLARAHVENGVKSTAPLLAGERFSWPLAAGEKLDQRLQLSRPLTAPVPAGTRVGEMIFMVNGQEVGRVSVLCGEAVLPRIESAMGQLKGGLPG